jgi:hypothetical protein
MSKFTVKRVQRVHGRRVQVAVEAHDGELLDRRRGNVSLSQAPEKHYGLIEQIIPPERVLRIGSRDGQELGGGQCAFRDRHPLKRVCNDTTVRHAVRNEKPASKFAPSSDARLD